MTAPKNIRVGSSRKQKKGNIWCNKWLTRGGTLVLFKSMLESILFYRVSLSFITKGVLEHLRKLSFKFLWAGTLEERFFLEPLTEIFLYPNTWVGGTSIISTAKCVWKLIEGRGLWVNTIQQKHIAPLTVEDWIRTWMRSYHNASIILNAVVLELALVAKWLVW